jgi:MFS family permease
MLSIAPFFTVAALGMGVSEATVGLYLSTQMAGAAASNLLWGWMGDRHGNRPVIIGVAVAGLAASAAALSATVVGESTLFLTFFLTGATMSGFRLGYPNFILEMAPEHLRATCVALQNTLLAPLVILPLVVGLLASTVSLSWVFGAVAALMAVGVFVTWRLIDPRKDPAGACIT